MTKVKDIRGTCRRKGPVTLIFEIEGREMEVHYPDEESVECVMDLIAKGPVNMVRGPQGELLVLCGDKEVVAGLPGTLVAIIRPDGIGQA